MCSSNAETIAVLRDALSSLVATPAAERGRAGAGERITGLLAARARLDAVVLAEVAAFDSSGAYVDGGSSTAVSWLRAAGRLGRRDASALVHQARTLRDLELTTAVLGAGAISREHAVQIVKAKAGSGLDAAEFARYEQVLVELSTKASPDEVRAAVQHLMEAEASDRDKRLVDALADRTFDVYLVGDLVRVDAVVDKATAEALVCAVDAMSRRAAGDERSWHVRRADAFSELVMLGVESGQLPQQGRVKPHIDLVMTLDQLEGIDGTGPLLKRFGRIPHATAQRLSCDAVMTRFITDAHGEVLDVGRSSRHTNAALSKAIALMYDCCAYPNCSTPLSQCDIHHVRWWSRGGATDKDNLIPLCKHHHMFIHEYGFTLHTGLDPGGGAGTGPHRWTFTSPRGHPIPEHRKTLQHYTEQLTLMPNPPEGLDGPRQSC